MQTPLVSASLLTIEGFEVDCEYIKKSQFKNKKYFKSKNLK